MVSIWAHRLGLLLICIFAFTGFFYLTSYPVSFVRYIRLRTDNDRLGAVASENKLCTQIGIDLIKLGGNAADAVRFVLPFPYCRSELIACRLWVRHYASASPTCITAA